MLEGYCGLRVRPRVALVTEHTSFKFDKDDAELSIVGFILDMVLSQCAFFSSKWIERVFPWQEGTIRGRTDLKSGNAHGSFAISISQEGHHGGRNCVSHLFKSN